MKLVTRDAYAERVRRPTLLEVARHEERYVERAENGDAVAAMALFCLKSANEIRIDEGAHLVIPADRDAAEGWLEMAARNGDCEAMVQYARSMEMRLRFGNGREASTADESAAIGAKAEAFLTTAAHRGYRDAFVLLGGVMETGCFGRVDRVGSLAFRVALNRLDRDRFTRRSVRRTERLVSTAERERASAAASILVRTVRAVLARDRKAVSER